MYLVITQCFASRVGGIENLLTNLALNLALTNEVRVFADSHSRINDEIFDSKIKELNDFVPVGVKSVIQEGFINVKKPLVLDTDMINWNPAKFLGGADPTGNLKFKA